MPPKLADPAVSVSTEPPDTNVNRYSWETFIRGARFTGVIPAQGKRGAVSATTFKAIALMWATYGNPDGSNVRPGVATVAVAAEVSFKTAKLVTPKLVELGLLKRVAPTDRRARKYDIYRLALPEDILDRVDHLDPDQMKKAGEAMREAYRGKPKTDSVGGPEDPTPDAEEDAPDELDDEIGVGSGGTPTKSGVGSSGPAVGGPVDCGTYPRTEPIDMTKPTIGEDLDRDVAVDRAAEDPIVSPVKVETGSPDLGPCPYPKCDGETHQMGVGRGAYRRRCPDPRHKK